MNRRLLIRGTPRRHAAVQYAVFDPRVREMQVASAGMPFPFHISPQGCRPIEISGIPPGLFATSVAYETSKLALDPGDSVLFLTDGVTEAFNTEDEGFGIERLLDICETRLYSSPADLLAQIFCAVEHFARGRVQHDDMAAALFHYGCD